MSIENWPKWVQEQVKKWLELPWTDIKAELANLSKETLISFLQKNKDVIFSKTQSPENSAAHIIAYQKALNLLWANIEVDGIYGDWTRSALKEFQASPKWGAAIMDDGIPGKNTANKLIAALGGASMGIPVGPKTTIDTQAAKVEHIKSGVLSLLTSIGVTGVTLENSGKPDWNGNIFTTDFTIGKRTLYFGIDSKGGIYIKDKTTPQDERDMNIDGSLADNKKLWSARTLDTAKQALEAVKRSENGIVTSTPETPTAKVEKAKKEVITMLGSLWINWVKLREPGSDGIIYTEHFKIWTRELYIGIWVTWRVSLSESIRVAQWSWRNMYIDTDGKRIESTNTNMYTAIEAALVLNRILQAEGKITATPTITLDSHPNSAVILKSVKSITWLESATLAWLGFNINGQEVVLPQWLAWTDGNKNAVKLIDGYEVKNGKIQKKVVSPVTDIRPKRGSDLI